MMGRKEVVDALERCARLQDAPMSGECAECAYKEGFGTCGSLSKLMMDAAELLKKSTTVSGWISVKDVLPETNDEVLTTYLYDDKPHKLYVETASYFDEGEGEGHWHSVWDEFSIGRVRKTTIAWMPMPKPYKPLKEDNDAAD